MNHPYFSTEQIPIKSRKKSNELFISNKKNKVSVSKNEME